ncbi:hypothetical protein BD779DRAFT_1678181 [Infundibulicybe gibba]|nr:hypothetical protein BD779DRAFT_1678181 [Infundibulicybe gibba]
MFLVEIFHSFTCQDPLPQSKMPTSSLHQAGAFLACDPESLRVDVSLPLSRLTTTNPFWSDRTIPSLTSQIKTATLEIAEINSRFCLRLRLSLKVYGLCWRQCTFCNQLTKPQLFSAILLLTRFAQADIREFASESISTLSTKVEGVGTPEKVPENDHIMKCVMRVVMAARQMFTLVYQTILARLVAILGVISKNPYAFQMLAQMLGLHAASVPAKYHSLLPFLLTPTMWQQKGSIYHDTI